MNKQKSLPPALLGVLGIVFGDIGTSPLYAFREALAVTQGSMATQDCVLGILSLLFWSLASVVTFKYLFVVFRMDNNGEGGILSLVALAQRNFRSDSGWPARILVLGMAGTALFYCDALITPAISILSAVEGLEVINPAASEIVVPGTLVIVAGLFGIQHRGTADIGRLFGPVMVLWFLVIAASGVHSIVRHPEVLAAIDPRHGLQLLFAAPAKSLTLVGAVFLVVTGGEALYADMGHFGSRPVRLAWLWMVWPSLLLNYFGQGAFVLANASGSGNLFFSMVPHAFLVPLLVIATFATIIASQATITGAFSITRQAVQLDLLPRLAIIQTSSEEHGQIYVPRVNLLMFIAVVLFVLGFRSSSALSGAYGVAVVGTMTITSLLALIVARRGWMWSWPRLLVVFGLFLMVDLAFLAGNLSKFSTGGWIPLLLAAAMYALFVVWRDGRRRLRDELVRQAVPIAKLQETLQGIVKVPGTAVYLVSQPGYVPTAMLRNLEHNRVAHRQVIILNLKVKPEPRVAGSERVRLTEEFPGVISVEAAFGFMETLSVAEAMRTACSHGLQLDDAGVSYFVGWHLVKAPPGGGFAGLKDRTFAYLQRRSTQAAEFFHMPGERVVILATDIALPPMST